MPSSIPSFCPLSRVPSVTGESCGFYSAGSGSGPGVRTGVSQGAGDRNTHTAVTGERGGLLYRFLLILPPQRNDNLIKVLGERALEASRGLSAVTGRPRCSEALASGENCRGRRFQIGKYG